MENQKNYKIDPFTKKRTCHLTQAEYRRLNQTEYLKRPPMSLEETRKRNNQPIESEETLKKSIKAQEGKFISHCLSLYLNGETEEELKNKFSERTISFVKSMIENAKKGNAGIVDQVLNRTEGKIKDVIELQKGITKPDQEEIKQLDNEFKAEPIEIQGKVEDET